jgi:MFS family permease
MIAPRQAGRVRHRAPRRPAAFAFVAYAFGVTMLGTTLPSPLYPLYQRQFGFTSLLTTVIYAVYAAGVLAVLLLFGRASDVVGRRRVLLAGLAASALSALVFLTGAGLPALFAGRVLSGLSAGALTATGTVTLIELTPARHRARAALFATVVNMLGLGCGPLLAGLLAQYAPAPLRLPYAADLLLLLPAAVGVWLAPETAPPRPAARPGAGTAAARPGSTDAEARPGPAARRAPWGGLPRPERPVVPAEARAVFVPAAVATFAAFAVFGLLTAIAPGFLATLLHEPSRALAGAVVFAMFAGSALGQVCLARLPERTALPVGCLILLAGLAGVGGALATASLPLLVAGSVVVGAGQGVSFRSGLAAITAASPPDRRAGTVASFFVAAYVAISVPVILVGVAGTLWGLRTAALWFTAAVAALTVGALVAVLRLGGRRAAGEPDRTAAARPPERVVSRR